MVARDRSPLRVRDKVRFTRGIVVDGFPHSSRSVHEHLIHGAAGERPRHEGLVVAQWRVLVHEMHPELVHCRLKQEGCFGGGRERMRHAVAPS